jgi:hypothetical protein
MHEQKVPFLLLKIYAFAILDMPQVERSQNSAECQTYVTSQLSYTSLYRAIHPYRIGIARFHTTLIHKPRKIILNIF